MPAHMLLSHSTHWCLHSEGLNPTAVGGKEGPWSPTQEAQLHQAEQAAAIYVACTHDNRMA